MRYFDFTYGLMTVHHGVILVNNQIDAQFFSCMFISILYMFRAAMCPLSGDLLYQCDTLFKSLYVDDRLVCRKNCASSWLFTRRYLGLYMLFPQFSSVTFPSNNFIKSYSNTSQVRQRAGRT